ncbi:uncharacterized protein BP01DRAFT_335356 [Aspergillus saccharolyticus JOP 1030-1]|uniref:Pre-mRNA-splicing factor 38B n=1 Tax=Aspergillus saccharolyticus JOP 1030-1 TaxID=1450539 RepID=A0A318ZU05_9EURO|nr:hypothetical protein BP01DRAFT_335356 [Aspergillus saccharolyticus JOP 1030-1]PYH47793.1 hypothetical protein BP01DRAFT_335356 [Aspergillus saccharolyticus JOP 1030-1]
MSPNLAKPLGALDDDDYVAQVLAREARDSSMKYSAQGLDAYMPRRPTGAAPKPNTRFLRHIIRETDSHNAALKRKEEREARERMRQLRNQASTSSHDTSREHRRRRDYPSDNRNSRTESRKERDDRHGSYRRRYRSRSRSRERDPARSDRRRSKDDGTRASGRDNHRRSRRHRSSSRLRSQSPRDNRKSSSRSLRKSYRTRDRSEPRSRSLSEERSDNRGQNDPERSRRTGDIGHHSSNSNKRSRENPPQRRPTATEDRSSEDESDPLEDLVGPLPPKNDGSDENAPIRSRGRGAYKPNTSNIDAHFAPDYDPTTDVQLEEDDLHSNNKSSRRHVPGLMTGVDDWDYALEALRDRARWKQKGEERLREAGFSTDFVERWKSNTSSKPEDDSEGRLDSVKWTKKGEGREWDRGKYVDEHGHIDVKASW